MGTPKAWLCYHNDQPQFQWVSSLLENIVSDVVISNGQLDLPLKKEWTLVPDLEKDQGPAAGVLAAFRKILTITFWFVAVIIPWSEWPIW
ncbi:MAG: NTP transferase domain-containing protein [Saprospiraceae bacterium]|nr:NTP transferase domain-containing protein [Saprospiraceae bacterium]